MILWQETARFPTLNLGFTKVDGRAMFTGLIALAAFSYAVFIAKLMLLLFIVLVVLGMKGIAVPHVPRMIRKWLCGGIVRTSGAGRKKS